MVSSVTERLAGFSLGAAIKAPVYVATTGANITLSSTQLVDGIAVGSCQRVLVKDQTDTTQNGVYISDSSTWVRASDCDGNRDLKPGSLVYVDRGTVNADTFWVFNSSSTALSVTIGTDAISLTQVTVALSAASVFGQALVANTSALQARSTLGFPTTSVDNAVLRANATAGLYQDSGWTLGDNSTMTAGGPLNSSNINMADLKLSRPKIEDYQETVTALGASSATAIDLDMEQGNVFSVTLLSTTARNFTFSNPPAAAGSLTIVILSSQVSTVVWPTAVGWAGGSAPAISSTGLDVLSFLSINGGTSWLGFVGGLDFK